VDEKSGKSLVKLREMDAEERVGVLEKYRKKLRELCELEAKLKSNRLAVADLVKEFNQTEDNLKALQSIGQIIGEVLKQLDDTRFIVKVG
jgi:26S proteasome regulatory subunit T4